MQISCHVHRGVQTEKRLVQKLKTDKNQPGIHMAKAPPAVDFRCAISTAGFLLRRNIVIKMDFF